MQAVPIGEGGKPEFLLEVFQSVLVGDEFTAGAYSINHLLGKSLGGDLDSPHIPFNHADHFIGQDQHFMRRHQPGAGEADVVDHAGPAGPLQES